MSRPIRTDVDRANVQRLRVDRWSKLRTAFAFFPAVLCAGFAAGQGVEPSARDFPPHASVTALPASIDARATDPVDPTHGGGLTLPYFDEPGDGALWVRGTDYKARFDERGLQFTPFLGSEAPRNFSVDFAIASARVGDRELDWNPKVAPQREGSTVTFPRGEFAEVFEVGPDSIEQLFLIERRLEGGDLEIRVRAESELEPGCDALGMRFRGELGGVDYGRATIFDARGALVPCETFLEGHTISIRASEVDLQRAEYPLIVDPIISSFAVGASSLIRREPKVAYDYDTNTFLSVFLEEFSSSDNDVVAVQLNGSGGVVPGGTTFIDFTTASWQSAAVANNNAQNQFMVAGDTKSGSVERVTVRTRAAGSTAMSAQVNVMSPQHSDGLYFSVDIGGDPYPWGTPNYCIAAVEWAGSTSWPWYSWGPVRVRYVCVSPFNTITASGYLDFGNASPLNCAISKSNGTPWYGNQRWTVVWNDAIDMNFHCGQVTAQGAPILSGASLGHFGTKMTEEFSVTTIFDEYAYDRKFFLTWHDSNLPWNWGVVCTVNGPMPGQTTLAFAGPAQSSPEAEYDGQRVIVTYEENGGGSDKNVFVSSFSINGSSINPVEVRVPVATGPISSLTPSICSKRSSGSASRDCMINWRNAPFTPGFPFAPIPNGIFGALYYSP